MTDETSKAASRRCRQEQCGRIVWEGDDDARCVFHSGRSEEKAEAFARAWERLLKKHDSGGGAYRYLNCRGFVFPGALTMNHVHLDGGADFRDARFDGPTHFEGVRFRENSYFSAAHFVRGAHFEAARFEKTAGFEGARFDANTFFEDVHFGGSARFERSLFGVETQFRGTHFAKDAIFREGRFRGRLRFVGTRFGGRLDLGSADGSAVTLEKSDLTGADLRECSLRDVQVTHVSRHRGVRFGATDVSGVDWTGSDGLRRAAAHQNAVFDFRRKNALNRWILYPLWKATSDCGRSPARWALAAAVVVVAFGGLYAWMGSAWFPSVATWDAASPYRESLRTLLTLGLSGMTTAAGGGAAARIVAILEGLLGVVLAASLLSILAAKFTRRTS